MTPRSSDPNATLWRGAIFGAMGGALLYAVDWVLPGPKAHIAWLTQLKAVLIFAALGAALGWLFAAARRFIPWTPALSWTALVAPALGYLCAATFDSFGLLLIGAGALALTFGAYLHFRLALNRHARLQRRGRIVAIIAFSVLLLAVSWLDQQVLPRLYIPLHTAATLGAWVLATCACFLLFEPRLQPPTGASKAALLLTLALAIAATWTIHQDPAGLASLVDARRPHADSAIRPLLALTHQSSPLTNDEALTRSRMRREAFEHLQEGRDLVLDQPHILVISIDALRADHLGVYGSTREGVSPTIDALAQESIVFEQAYASAPHSSYSLTSLWTGNFIKQRVDLGATLQPSTLVDSLDAAGYFTSAHFYEGIFYTDGSLLSVYDQSHLGFANASISLSTAEETADAAVAQIEDVRLLGEPPSLLWFHFMDVHEPYRDTHYGTADIDRYDSEIRHADREIARILEAAKTLTRPVIIAFTSDHGEEFRDHGGLYHGSTLYQEQIRVPLILHIPDFPARRIRAPVQHVDLIPTLMAIAQVPAPQTDGHDLRALIAAEDEEELAELPAFASVSFKKMVVRDGYKLIADLRFGVEELFDLESDPRELSNLVAQEPERAESMRAELYAWLDEIARLVRTPPALAMGRSRDRRAVGPLCTLLLDEDAPLEERAEAAQLLARLADPQSTASLLEAMRSPVERVRFEAAIALGRQADPRAQALLLEAIASADPHIRYPAAVSLGRLRDPRAIEPLIDALTEAPDEYERQEAVRWLGRLRDPRAYEPMLAQIRSKELRLLVLAYLGHLGDPRAYAPLMQALQWETHSQMRDQAIRGLGLLADPRATQRVLEITLQEAELNAAPETLLRLGALERGEIGGLDPQRERDASPPFASCEVGPLLHDWDYEGRTRCTSQGPEFSIDLASATDAAQGYLLIVRMRRVDQPAPMSVGLEGVITERAWEVDGQWRELRRRVTSDALSRGATLHFRASEGQFELDHALLLPLASASPS